MLVEGVNLYIKLFKVYSLKEHYAGYAGMGWGKYARELSPT